MPLHKLHLVVASHSYTCALGLGLILAAPHFFRALSQVKGLQTCSNGQIKSLIRPSLVSPWSRSRESWPSDSHANVITLKSHLLIEYAHILPLKLCGGGGVCNA